ncbi:AaceriAGR180Wp [[Ashbya] aceris (nom. inval.)]|nr:AaceriAGR180Wp [[Ashbya] aceris (nom. inval.)]
MDLKTTFLNRTLAPFYANSGAVASVTGDGSLLATCVLDDINIVSLEEPHTIVHRIENDDEQDVTALRLTPDGRYLCYVSQNQLLRVYDLETKKTTRSMKISSPAYVLDCDDSSTLLAVGGTDGSVNVFDIANGYVTHSLKGHGATISSVKFYGEVDSGTWLLVSGDTNGMVKIWDLVKRRCLHTIQEHTAAVRGLDIRVKEGAEALLLSGGRDDVVNIHHFDMKKKCKLLQTVPVKRQIESCGFIGDDTSLIYTAGGDAVYQLISLTNGKPIKQTVQPVEELFIVGVLPVQDSTKCYLVLSDQTLFLIDVEKALSQSETTIQIEKKIAGNHGTIADMRLVGPSLNRLALATNSPTLRIVPTPQASEDKEVMEIETEMYEGHTDLLNSLDATNDGLWLATASKDHSVILWRYVDESSSFEPFAKFLGHAGPVTAVALPNVMNRNWPEFLLTASNDLTIKRWKVPNPNNSNLAEGPHIVKASEYTRRAHEKDINAISMAPNDSVFATASYDKTCKIWNVDTGEVEATLANHKRGLWGVAFCQYDKLLATCSGDKTIKLWSLENFTVLKTFEGHTNAVQRVSFINRNKQLVSTGADGLVKIWDCSTGECVRTLDAHNNRIWALVVANDGQLFITADADGVFQFWEDNSEEEHERNIEQEKKRVEQEQSLQNYISEGDWNNAFLLAMTLDHPMRLYHVLERAIAKAEGSEAIFNQELDHIVGTLDNEQLLKVMRRCRDWNTNARTHSVAQKMIRCILLQHNLSTLSEIPGLIQLVDSIVPYIERHYGRLDTLVEQTYLLDYALIEMDKLL